MNRVGTVVVAAMALGLVASHALAESSIVLPKAGQVGLLLGGGYGSFLESGNVGSRFGSGPEFNVRVRYRMRYERALGLSFESQSLDVRVAPPPYVVGVDSTAAPTKLSTILSGFEFYQMFGTRTKSVKMLMVGAGLAQMRAEFNNGDTELSGVNSGDGLYVSAGAGLERFVFRSWAVDFSGRYYAVFRDGNANHNFQIALGAIFYAGY
jgi:hypothetical protein